MGEKVKCQLAAAGLALGSQLQISLPPPAGDAGHGNALSRQQAIPGAKSKACTKPA